MKQSPFSHTFSVVIFDMNDQVVNERMISVVVEIVGVDKLRVSLIAQRVLLSIVDAVGQEVARVLSIAQLEIFKTNRIRCHVRRDCLVVVHRRHIYGCSSFHCRRIDRTAVGHHS